MAFYTLTPGSATSSVFAHSGGTLEVVIYSESVLRAGAKVVIQAETAASSGIYKTLANSESTKADTVPYLLSACNVKAVLVGGDATTTAEVRLVSVA